MFLIVDLTIIYICQTYGCLFWFLLELVHACTFWAYGVSYALIVELSLFLVISTHVHFFYFFFDFYYVYILSFHIAFTFHTYSDVIMVPSFDLFRLLTIRRLLCPNKWHNHNSCFESLFLWSTLPLWLSRAMIPTKYMLFDSHATLYICSLM